MIVMITTRFFQEYSLFKTEDPADLETYAAEIAAGAIKEHDESKHKYIGGCDGPTEYLIMQDAALAMADKVICLDDLIDEE